MELLDNDYYDHEEYKSVDSILNNGYSTNVSRYISEAWEIFKLEPGYFVGYFLISSILGALAGLIPIIGSIFSYFFIGPCFSLGFFYVTKKIDHREIYEFSNFFDGFRDWRKVVPSYGLGLLFTYFWIVVGVIVVLSAGFDFEEFILSESFPGILPYARVFILFLFLMIPMIYLAVAYIFIVPIVAFYRGELELMEILEASRKVITKKWWNFVGLFFLLGLLNIIGAFCLIVGLLVTIPISGIAIYTAYKDIFGVTLNDENTGFNFRDNLVEY